MCMYIYYYKVLYLINSQNSFICECIYGVLLLGAKARARLGFDVSILWGIYMCNYKRIYNSVVIS
jgi:hypothetical protein